MDILKILEDTVLATLKSTLAGKVKTIELYSDQLSAGTMDDITFRFPCVYLVAGGVSFEPNNRVTQAVISLTVYVGDNNARGDFAAKRGTGTNPGVYWILEQIRVTLNGLRVDSPGLSPLQIKRVEPAVYAPQTDLLIYTASFECKWLF